MKITRISVGLIWTSLVFCSGLVCAQDVFIASYNGDLETVRKMVERNPGLVSSRNESGRFLLEMAAQTGKIEVVKFLLAKGADVNMNRGGVTALHMAALYGGNAELVSLLLEKGADINARTGEGATPLNLAVIGKQKEIADLLLDKGGEINLENQDFTRLLMTSASAGIGRIVDVALKHEIDFRFETGNGDSLLHAAAEGGLASLARALLAKGLNVDAGNIYGMTPLHVAARGGHKEVIDLLLSKGVAIDVIAKSGKSPFHLAKEKGHEDVAEDLKSKGADTTAWAFPVLTGKYLDQPPPGEVPVIFAPGIVSAEEHFEHSALAFSPDYSEVYWSSDFTEFGFYDIVCMKKVGGRWAPPELAPFSKEFHAGSPVFSVDGKKLYFSTVRPRFEGAGGSDGNIWVVEREGPSWSEPRPLDEPVNTTGRESVMGITREGTLYFRRELDFFRAKKKNGGFENPVKLDLKLETGARILALSVAPDESYLLMESRGGGINGGADLYVSFRRNDGSWTEGVSLGPEINAGGHERFPLVTPDGRYLFFLRVNDGSDFFWVDAKVIENLRRKELNR
jgi:ankyrin repeat protein